ncbi:MAG TPA: DNA translocase FtsK 4TM domain-containing protein [Pyrinomonadaceae bacterium]|nr:DNA translocase FtsK 4TM domain-containing protein [Pyrinomonadaceae bacterium]HMP66432.1 DNA translocase FtsK 4TM domain-containing protein [Pyrinomonadaceae bacterium]
MKVCPTCKKTYKDEGLNYCLDDGATLLQKGSKGVRTSRLNEVVALAVGALAVLIFLSLVSYNSSDPSFNTATSERVRNWIGVVGSHTADLLLQAAGLVSYVFPLLLGLIAWRVFNSEDLRPRWYRVLGFLLFVAALGGLINLAVSTGWRGGVIGEFFAVYTTYMLSTIGATILLSTLFLASLLMISDLSFLGLWGHFEVARDNFRIRLDEWKEKRRKEKEAETALARERMEKRRERRTAEPPTIVVAEPKTKSAGKGKTMAATGDELFRTMPDALAGQDDEPIPPTIAVPDVTPMETAETVAAAASGSGEIPISARPATGDLNPESDGELSNDEAEPTVSGEMGRFENYILPTPEFLHESPPKIEQKENEMLDIARLLVERTKEFNVAGKVEHIFPGPVVTTYEFKPAPGVKYSRVTGLVDDLCLALKAESIRIDRIPGKAFVGIEVPNKKRETIYLRDVIESKKFKGSDSLLTIGLGKTIDGLNYVTDLAKMPHLLIAGATGAGKSVGVNAIVVSILYKAKPDEVKFIMVDPKRLELGVYADIPHLATPIITDPKRAAISLKWAVTEMERRYKDLAGYGVRNIDGYNTEAKRRNSLEIWDENGEPHRTLPYIVIIIDELADLMMVSGKDVEESITRLAQMARAVGIHLVLATQRPSVDVITGLIKANFPARISFRVSSKVDSRTIIDSNGAEGLLGRGDMLFLPPATSQVVRVHGAYVDEKEIAKIVEHIKAQGRPEYDTSITKSEEEMDDGGDLPGRRDPLFWDALKCVINARRGSTSLLQRHLRIGYGRAAAILDAMVKEGYIGEMDGSTRARPVLQKAYDDLQDMMEMENA